MIHSRSCPFLSLVLAFCLGLILQDRLFLPMLALALIAGILLVSNLFCRRWFRVSSLILHLFFVLLGSLYFCSYQKFPVNHIYYLLRQTQEETFRIEGRIVSEITRKRSLRGERTTFVLALSAIRSPSFSARASGKVLVRSFRPIDGSYGDRVIYEGKFNRPYDFSRNPKFSYRRYLRRQGIYFVSNIKKNSPAQIYHEKSIADPLALLYFWRERCQATLRQYLFPQQAGLMAAFLVGQRADISPNILQIFIRTGTAHLLAISGSNVGVVAVMVFILLRLFPVPWRLQYALSVIFLIIYALLTGASPSVVRATIMAVIFLGSSLLERESDGMNSLAWAGFLILLINPNYIFDIGFQLSFLSVLGILLFYPVLSKVMTDRLALKAKGVRTFFWKSFAVSLSAWLGAAGLVAYYFDIVTPGALLANLIAVPLMSVLVVLGIGLLLTGWSVSFIAENFAVCLKLTLTLLVKSMALLSQVPGVCFYVRIETIWPVITYYAAVGLIYWWTRQAGKGGEQAVPLG